jgi:carbonic anhydrase/acetyltransferase-like protein (isoleucine patch superfamily)
MIIDDQRSARGLRTVSELLELAEAGTIILDPYSVLLGTRVRLGDGNVLYPGVVIECDPDSECELGSGNTLLPGTFIAASNGGSIVIGDNNRIGEGGARIMAAGSGVTVGHRTRISSGPVIVAPADLGDGCQVLGQITAQQVHLTSGADFSHPDPDHRGAVLKGFGKARDLTVNVGEVINGSGDFATAPIERQRTYHPGAPTLPAS